jgi:hypothetical protein
MNAEQPISPASGILTSRDLAELYPTSADWALHTDRD